jgi:CHAT domain-containing protein
VTVDAVDAFLHGSPAAPGWTHAYNALLKSPSDAAVDNWIDTIDRVCHQLGKVIGTRVDAALLAAGVGEGAPVAIAPSPQLSILPLHAAWWHSADGARCYLGSRYAITYTPSLATLTQARTRRSGRPAAPLSLLAVATGDPPNTATEASVIEGYFPAGHRETLYGPKATSGKIAELATGRTHVHLACHASFDPDDPARSALDLADGPVLADALPGIIPLADLELVTLSACETGLLDNVRAPSEWLGIAGTLSRAGATDVVCTLWAIDDEATAKLMDHFYRSAITDGAPPGYALRAAQAAARHDADLEHPFYWAAFIHVGVARHQD